MRLDESELEKELRGKLSVEQLAIYQNMVAYYDFHGVTIRESDEEKQIVKKYITQIIGEKIGNPVQVTRWGRSDNGHFAHYFKKL